MSAGCSAGSKGILMKRKLPSAKVPLPKLGSDEAAAEYFETHSVADVWNQLPEAKQLKLSKATSQNNPGTACGGKVSDLNPIGSRTDRGGEEDRGGQVRRLPDTIAHVDCRGDSPRGEPSVSLRSPLAQFDRIIQVHTGT
jgi:hypothetical protein